MAKAKAVAKVDYKPVTCAECDLGAPIGLAETSFTVKLYENGWRWRRYPNGSIRSVCNHCAKDSDWPGGNK